MSLLVAWLIGILISALSITYLAGRELGMPSARICVVFSLVPLVVVIAQALEVSVNYQRPIDVADFKPIPILYCAALSGSSLLGAILARRPRESERGTGLNP